MRQPAGRVYFGSYGIRDPAIPGSRMSACRREW